RSGSGVRVTGGRVTWAPGARWAPRNATRPSTRTAPSSMSRRTSRRDSVGQAASTNASSRIARSATTTTGSLAMAAELALEDHPEVLGNDPMDAGRYEKVQVAAALD